ncbi:hypothetical protein HGG72_16890 [Ochrobactrum pecoris]|uniref:MAPEG superfamily protein n=1 Tax=Brucella pecoris TaxID=867683 RepID=A0A5C5CGI6_9HYPH|nr:hypothetical protein [Brucella pecoris]MBB4095272.1 putative MAPEG superfamily protein [Brucella pecoris]NKW81604.1 hypothetical protein [Brucella pecoris]TNV10509.1 hypothetical protein FIB18_16185 [Brucella pecoris]
MTIELRCLAASSILALLFFNIPRLKRSRISRDRDPAYLTPFAIAVLVAHAANISNRATIAGATLFLVAAVVGVIGVFLENVAMVKWVDVVATVSTVLIYSQLV